MAMHKYILPAALMALLGGCETGWEHPGYDTKALYQNQVPKNTVETSHLTQDVHFTRSENRLPPEELASLSHALKAISPEAVETVQIQLNPAQMKNNARRAHLTKFLHTMSFAKDRIMFEPSDTLAKDDAHIDVTYAAVVPPDCPNWTASPITTYDNLPTSNFGCASSVNLGAMVADPRDLYKGEGRTGPDTQSGTLAIRAYHDGKDPSSSSSGSSSSSSGGSSTGVTATQ